MTTTTELHAAIYTTQALLKQAADVIERNTKSLTKVRIITDTEVLASIESDTDLVAHLRAAALPWDQRHKPAAQEPIGYVSEADGSVTWKGIMPPFGARLTMQADVPEAKFGDMAAPAQEPVDTQKPAQQGQAIDIAFLRQVLSVAIAGLFEHHKDDVLRVFTPGELQAVVDLTEPLHPQQVEDIYKRAWVMLTTPPAQRTDDTNRLDALAENYWDLRCFSMSDDDVGWRVIEHHMEKPNERTVAEVFRDDPRQAIDAAIEAAHGITKGGAQ